MIDRPRFLTGLTALAVAVLLAAPAVAATDDTPPDAPAPSTTTSDEAAPDQEAEADAVTPDPGLTWGIVPSDAEGVPDDRVSFRLSLDPGTTITEHVVVTNYSGQDVTFRLVASDGVLSETGAFDLLPSDVAPVDVGSWVSIVDHVDVPAGQSAPVPFELTVPADATPGDHPGGIVASVLQEGGTQGGPSVGVETRVGTRIHLRVTGEIRPSLSITDLSTRYETSWNPLEGGTLHVSYTVVNDGNVRLGSIQQHHVAGPFGLDAGGEGPSGSVLAQQREVLPGQQTRVSAEVTGVWSLARLSTTVNGFQEAVGDDVISGPIPGATAELTSWVVPWPQLAVLALVVLIVVALVMQRRRHRARFAAAIARARAEGAAGQVRAQDARQRYRTASPLVPIASPSSRQDR